MNIPVDMSLEPLLVGMAEQYMVTLLDSIIPLMAMVIIILIGCIIVLRQIITLPDKHLE